jgi:hypothetical protein
LAQEIGTALHAGETERCSGLCKALMEWAEEFIAGNQ